jgi:uncharacterized protein YeaO (DUF488 family)
MPTTRTGLPSSPAATAPSWTTRAGALAHLRALVQQRPLTLLTATKNIELSQAAVLAQLITG